MNIPEIFESEYRLCLLVWEHQPVNSTRLAALCSQALGWSKATTYTVIRRLCQRGVLHSEHATVTALVSREEVQRARVEAMMETTFQGSVPAFLAAFSRSKHLSPEETARLQALVDSFGEDQP